MSRYFPLFIDLEKKKVTVIGAGTIASRRIRTLLNFGAQITVLAPEASEEVRGLAEEGKLVWRKGLYAPGLPGLLEDAAFVLAATDSPETNQAVWQECRAHGIPVNLSNDREKCDFYFPGIAAGGGIVAGITAEGKNHRLAREVTEQVRDLLAQREREAEDLKWK